MTNTSLEVRAPGADRPAHHLVSLLVENKAGVLSRVAGLFARRAFNIFSLAVAPTDDARFSRISVVVDVDSTPLEQILSQLNKLINVVEISELHPDDAHEAELLLATVRVDEPRRQALDELCGRVGASTLDEASDARTVMVAGDPALLDEVEDELKALGLVELQRTGRIALPKLGAAKRP